MELDIRAWLSPLGDLLTGVAAVGATVMAAGWRRQKRQERQAEAAAQVLSHFLDAARRFESVFYSVYFECQTRELTEAERKGLQKAEGLFDMRVALGDPGKTVANPGADHLTQAIVLATVHLPADVEQELRSFEDFVYMEAKYESASGELQTRRDALTKRLRTLARYQS